jgi:hypothetical protein
VILSFCSSVLGPCLHPCAPPPFVCFCSISLVLSLSVLLSSCCAPPACPLVLLVLCPLLGHPLLSGLAVACCLCLSLMLCCLCCPFPLVVSWFAAPFCPYSLLCACAYWWCPLVSLPRNTARYWVSADVNPPQHHGKTAQILALSEANVKTRLSRARLQMRDALASGLGGLRSGRGCEKVHTS